MSNSQSHKLVMLVVVVVASVLSGIAPASIDVVFCINGIKMERV